MRRPSLLLPAFALMLLSACGERAGPDEAKPGTILIDRIERQLAGRPCIGALDRWERHYAFGGEPDDPTWGQGHVHADRDRISFAFMEAGRYEFRSRRVIETPASGSIDDRPMRFAFGEYHVASGRLFVHACGGNSGGPPSQAMYDSINAARDAP
jgi:hypothetical protein